MIVFTFKFFFIGHLEFNMVHRYFMHIIVRYSTLQHLYDWDGPPTRPPTVWGRADQTLPPVQTGERISAIPEIQINTSVPQTPARLAKPAGKEASADRTSRSIYPILRAAPEGTWELKRPD